MLERLFRKPPAGPNLLPTKLRLIELAIEKFGVRSFADLGGVWGVEGGYTFHALDKGATSGTLVDTHPTDIVLNKAKGYPSLKFVRDNFGSEMVAKGLGNIDAVFLFDTLLHQVTPDWDQVLEMYARQARCLLIYNQQWIGPGRRLRLFDLGEKEYFANVPHKPNEEPYIGLFNKLNTPHPDHGGRLWRDVHHVWQWGITDADLLEKTQSLGFKFQHYVNDGQFGTLANFENHAFLFTR